MSDDNEIPKSANLGHWSANEFHVTAASWRGEYGESFEVGIRHKTTDKFTLIQSRGWNRRTVITAGLAIATLLDSGLSPDKIGDLFCGPRGTAND